METLRKMQSDYWLPIHPKVRKVIVVTIIGLITLVIALASLDSQAQSVQFDSNPSAPPISTGKILVHVVGQVVNPGVYELDGNSRVKDAIIAADGFKPKADQTSLNLARILTDGEQIIVGQSGKTSQSVSSKINVNRAPASELEKLPGIGPALAARIIDYRLANGSYQDLNDLGKVAGIGPKLLAKLKPEVSF